MSRIMEKVNFKNDKQVWFKCIYVQQLFVRGKCKILIV